MFRAVISKQRPVAALVSLCALVFACCVSRMATAVSAAEPPVTAGLKLRLDIGETAAPLQI
ncbi:MAG: hypothetical protein ACK5AN_03625, partial [Planctomyces sp.]